jgi:hypothetical protein
MTPRDPRWNGFEDIILGHTDTDQLSVIGMDIDAHLENEPRVINDAPAPLPPGLTIDVAGSLNIAVGDHHFTPASSLLQTRSDAVIQVIGNPVDERRSPVLEIGKALGTTGWCGDRTRGPGMAAAIQDNAEPGAVRRAIPDLAESAATIAIGTDSPVDAVAAWM